jgi:hypothetical protein
VQANYAAQAPQDGTPDAVLPAAAPSGVDSGAPPASPLTKEQRDRLAQEGREKAEYRRRAEHAEQQASQALNTVNQLVERDQAEYRRQYDAWLASLSPEQRAMAVAEEAKATAVRAQQELAQMRQASQQPPQRAQMSQDEISARKAELVEQVSRETGVSLTGSEPGVDDTNEIAFMASLRATATHYNRSQQQPNAPDYGRPLSVRPAPGQNVTSESIEAAMWNHSSKRPWELRNRTRQMNEEALRQAGMS